MKKIAKELFKSRNELLLELNAAIEQNAELKAQHEKEINQLNLAAGARLFMCNRLQLMISSIQYSILVVDENNKIEFINELCCGQYGIEKNVTKWLGYKADDFLSLVLPSYASPNATYENIKAIISQNKIVSGEEVLMKDGKVFLVDFVPLIVDGKLAGRMWIHRDITERKRYEELLKQSYELHSSLIGTTHDGFWTTDLKGNILEVNKSYCEASGYSKSQLLKMNALEIEYLESELHMGNRLKELTDKGFLNYDSAHKCADGSIKYFEAQAKYLEERNNILVFFKDVTKRKLTELELLKLSRVVMQSPVSILITDPDGRIEYANPKFTETSGYSLEEVLGKNPRILNSGYHSKEFYEDMWGTILSGKDWAGELCNKHKNGQLYWESLKISPIVNDEGDITNYVNIKTDITEKKKMVEELIASKEKAEQSDNLKSEFLAQMSHEIRTPMNVIINFTSLLNEELKEKLTEQTLEYIKGINSSSERLIRTINLLLNVSEMLTGTYKPKFEEIDLIEEIIENVRKEYTGLIEGMGLKINFILNCSEALIVVDKYSVYQIFENLIDNAVKYTKEGAITIKVDSSDKKKEISVCVEDTGIGISEEFMGRIFKPFTQEDHGYSKRYEGNGLGLTLVKKYCDLNKITIAVASQKNEGTKITLTFPVLRLAY